MYKLIGSPTNRSFRVMWMFEELGVEYEMLSAGPRAPEIARVNPSGKVPALIVGDDVIIDSSAIIQYLADAHNQFTYKAGTIERAKQDSFLHFANDDMDGICWTAAKHNFIFPEELRHKEVIESCKWDWENSLKWLEERLGDNQYVMGDEFTVPDIVIAHTAGWAKFVRFPWREGKVSEYFERVRSRPAFVKSWAMRKEFSNK